MSDLPTLKFLIAFALLFWIVYRTVLNRRQANSSPLPPGPAPLPLLGNLLDVPSKTTWLTYTEWSKKYGNIIRFNVFGNDVIIINSLKMAMDLMEKRSLIYSDRPKMPVLELMGWDFNVGLVPYGDDWRHSRTILHRAFRPEAAVAYQPIQMNRAHALLRDLLHSPDEFHEHIKNLGASIVMHTVYGHQIASKNDRFVMLGEETVAMLGYAVFPGAQILNAFPMLQSLPAWFPGIGFKYIAEKCRSLCDEMQDVPFQFVKTQMKSGTGVPSLTRELLEEGKETEKTIKAIGASVFAAGSDTSVSVVTSLILAMVLYPDVQKKAHEEIDGVLGGSRLPTWEDRPLLPYIDAICRELLRWRPVTPLGVAHSLMEDDFYNGYLIPKGATIIGNTWAMSRDPTLFPDPETFDPAHFLTKEGKLTNDDMARAAFGFGRRVCVGKHFGEASVWSAVVSILATYHISKAKDERGCDIEVTGEYTDGIACHPVPFRCSITPRSEEARTLILESDVPLTAL